MASGAVLAFLRECKESESHGPIISFDVFCIDPCLSRNTRNYSIYCTSVLREYNGPFMTIKAAETEIFLLFQALTADRLEKDNLHYLFRAIGRLFARWTFKNLSRRCNKMIVD